MTPILLKSHNKLDRAQELLDNEATFSITSKDYTHTVACTTLPNTAYLTTIKDFLSVYFPRDTDSRHLVP
jgi:hypothetical protein